MHKDTPVLLASLGWGEGQPIKVDRLFEKSERQTVGFEVAFAAFVATVILTVPSTETWLDPTASIVAVLLLAVTVARRMAIDSKTIDRESFMNRTTHYILVFTFIGMFYVSFSFARLLSSIIIVNQYIIGGVIIFIGTFSFLFLYEQIYRDLFLWFSIQLYNLQLAKPNTNSFYNGLLSLARWLLEIPGYSQDQQNPVIKEIYHRDLATSEEQARVTAYLIFLIIFLFLIGVFVIAAFPLTYVLEGGIFTATFVSLTVSISSLAGLGVVQFIYSRYGNTSLEKATDRFDTVTAIVLTYVLILLYAGFPMSLLLKDGLPM